MKNWLAFVFSAMASLCFADGATRHELILADESHAQLRYVNQFDPAKSFSVSVEKPVWDLQRVGETRYRVIGQNGFLVVDLATRKICDSFKTKELGGVTSVSDLPDGGFIACVNHPSAQKEVDVLRFSRDRKLVNRICFHGIFYARMMTRLANGELIITHDNGMIRAKLPEQGGEGTVLQTFEQPRSRNMFQAVPARDGSGYWAGIGYGAELVFYGLDGKLKKAFEAKQPNGLKNHFYAQPVELPNGNVIVANWNGHQLADGKKGWQVIEFDRDGKVVWFLYDPVGIGSVSSVYVLR